MLYLSLLIFSATSNLVSDKLLSYLKKSSLEEKNAYFMKKLITISHCSCYSNVRANRIVKMHKFLLKILFSVWFISCFSQFGTITLISNRKNHPRGSVIFSKVSSCEKPSSSLNLQFSPL